MIITIGGEYGCGSKESAKIFAQMSGYKLCDDEIVGEAVKESGVDLDRQTYEYYDESAGNASVNDIERLSNVQRRYRSRIFTLSKDVLPLDGRLEEAMKKVLNRFADEDNCIILGRCANYYLRDRENVISLFFVDTEENKTKRIAAHLECDDEEAKKFIKKTDKRRQEYHEFFTGEKWADPNCYDAIINTDAFGEEGCAKLIEQMISVKEGK